MGIIYLHSKYYHTARIRQIDFLEKSGISPETVTVSPEGRAVWSYQITSDLIRALNEFNRIRDNGVYYVHR